MKINKKGFTLIELIAAIAILGIMSGIAVAAVSTILKNSREEYYKSLRSTIVMAAKSYYADHRSMLPKTGKTRKITVQKLVETKYLEKKPTAHDKETLCVDGTYVEVTKIAKDKYDYKITLTCGNISSSLTNEQ